MKMLEGSAYGRLAMPGEGVIGKPYQVLAHHPDLAFAGLLQARNQMNQAGFARARRPHQGRPAGIGQGPVEILKQGRAIAGESKRHVAQFYEWGSHK